MKKSALEISILGLVMLLILLLYAFCSPKYIFHQTLILQAWPDRLECVKFFPDSGSCVTAGSNYLYLWNLDGSGKRIVVSGLGPDDDITTFAFSPDGTLLALANFDNNVRVFETGTWKQKLSLDNARRSSSLAFCINGRTLAVGTGDYDEPPTTHAEIKLWDLQSGKLQRSLRGDVGYTKSLVTCEDGETLVSSNGSLLQAWDIRSGNVIATLRWEAPFSALVAAPGGDLVAAGDEMGKIILWHARLNGQPCVIQAHRMDVESLAFLPDGKYLASGSIDGTVKLWDVVTRSQVGSFRGVRPSFVHTIDVSQDGTKMAIGTLHGPFSVWEIVRD
jgi:WD40 repeat protein